MHKRTAILVLGIVVALSPFFGVPYTGLMWLLPVLGIAIAVLAYPMRRKPAEDAPEPTHEAPAGF